MRRAQDRSRSARSRKNGPRTATIESRALGALKLASETRDENVPATRADFFHVCHVPRRIRMYYRHGLGLERNLGKLLKERENHLLKREVYYL